MFGNLGKIMKVAGEMKAMQAELAESEYSAEAGGGAVAATVNGKMALVDVKIDSKMLSDGEPDAEMLADLVKAAITAAQEKAAAAAAEAVKELTGGMNIPGLTP
ncbi:MAG: YbaB/EbfC family nucleoid-associated protein [Planctomycetota bacterium]|nr:YbaB/EbfC family nucleoid-associated protein [Planctomycetota bacterium]